MQAGNLISSDVMAYTSRVLVNGTQRPVQSWSISRELNGDLPMQVTAASGIVQATGNIVWVHPDHVSSSATNPFNKSTGWVPAKGDRVEIFAGDGVSEWKQFHGLIDSTRGTVNGGFESTIIDDFDKLSAKFSHYPLLRVMSPYAEGYPARGVGLTSTYYVDAALRTAGFYGTPPTEANGILHVPGQGSTWTDRGQVGTMLTGAGYDGALSHARNFQAPWGWAISNFKNTYLPRTSPTPSTPLQVTVCVAPNHTGFFTLDVFFGATRVRLAIWASRSVNAYLGTTNLVGLTPAQFAGATIITLLYKSGVWTLKANNGATATGTATIGGSAAIGSIAMEAEDGARVAGIQVSSPATAAQEFASQAFTPNAFMDLGSIGSFSGLMDAGRAQDQVAVADLVSEISDATLAAMWIDELGVFRFTPSITLNSRAPVRTLTTKSEVTTLGWEDSYLGSRSKVTVKHLRPALALSRSCSRTVYQGNSNTMESGESTEEFIEPAGNEDWVQVDSSLTVLGFPAWSPYNGGRFSYSGGYFSNTGAEIADPSALSFTAEMTTVGINRFKIKHAVGTLPAGVEATTSTSPNSSALYPQNRNQPLPVIRAFGQVTWSEETWSPVSAGGAGPELEHDAGYWNALTDSTAVIEQIAAYLASQTAVPKPTITNLEVVYDPRLQLGDVIKIDSSGYLGVVLTGLIVGMENSGGGVYAQSLSIRIISATTTFTTFEEFNRSSGGALTFQQWQALGVTPQTFTQFNTEQEA